jgi:hypothetical protein
MDEVDKLRRQVERLGGEVEVLRGVVEAGLNERRKFRDGLSFSMTGGDGESGGDGRLTVEELEKEEVEESVVKQYPRSALKSRNHPAVNKAKDTRRAMVISPHITSTVDSEQSESRERDNANERSRQERLIDLDDSDIAERNANGGNSNDFSNVQNTSFSRNLSAPRRSLLSPEPDTDLENERSRLYGYERGGRVASTSRVPLGGADTSEETEKVGDEHEEDEEDNEEAHAFRPPSRPGPRRALRTSSPRRQVRVANGTPHPKKFGRRRGEDGERSDKGKNAEANAGGADTDGDVNTNANTDANVSADGYVPFPRIRGARLEKLFFNAPDHNEVTCNVCRRRERKSRRGRRASGSSEEGEEVDEGFGEEEEEGDLFEHEHEHRRHHTKQRRSSKRDRWEKVGRGGVGFGEDKTPPQTVVVRVLRELEDDFTHYKG